MTTIEQSESGMQRTLEFVFNIPGTPYMLVFDKGDYTDGIRCSLMTTKSERVGLLVKITKSDWTILTRELFPPESRNLFNT